MSPPTTKSNSGLCDFYRDISPYIILSIQLEGSSRRCPLCKLLLDELIKSSHPIKLKRGRVREVCAIIVRVTNSNAYIFLHTWADESSDAALSESCLRSYIECNSVPLADADTSSTTRFPTRLLDLRTLKSNLAEHAAGINISTIPVTLRDTIIVIRNLSLRYLWIDALCLIYQNAHFTIAATGSSLSTGGLFHPRNTTTNQPIIELSYRPLGGSSIEIRTFIVGPYPTSFNKIITATVSNYPLILNA
ncbi:hypothetical protein QBC40DRAFT_311239 [Triangularia verruculosa]|uniref:Heterokaryon incompatibility domain-containing protein n=1 Tax=Triangularia verruculosa TaxID=2587418 RepID=A0AAN6X6D9_9PEZI|nr:hypothetical protein QBC40DRAFT_311239 [Triangularia verruculosa]